MESNIGLKGNLNGKKKLMVSLVMLFAIGSLVANLFAEQKETPPEDMETLDLGKTENIFYLLDTEFEKNMKEIVYPYIRKCMTEGMINGYEGCGIHYEAYKNPKAKGIIMIHHGFTENADKYAEMIYYFLKKGYSVYIMEARGHGYSKREISDVSKVHVERFTDYVEDMKCFMDEIVVKQGEGKPCFLYAHSMGGAVGSYFLESYPEYFDAAVLSSPMMEINCGEYPEKVTELIADTMVLCGRGKDYIWGQGPFSADYNFEASSVGTEERYQYYLEKKKENQNYQTYGGTFSWLKTNIAATRRITSEKYASVVNTPSLLFQAENDKMVKRSGQYRYAKYAKNTKLILVPGAKHEIYTMQSETRIPYYNTIFEFFEKYGS